MRRWDLRGRAHDDPDGGGRKDPERRAFLRAVRVLRAVRRDEDAALRVAVKARREPALRRTNQAPPVLGLTLCKEHNNIVT